MAEKDQILSELASVAPALIPVVRQMPFGVPEGYFELLAMQLLAKVNLPLNQPGVPAGYFDNLPALMLAKVKSLAELHELETIAPALIGINRQMPFTLPGNYFENFSVFPVTEQQPAIAIKEVAETPVVSLSTKKNNVRWIAAASVIALAGLFTWQALLKNPGRTPQPLAIQSTSGDSAVNSFFAAALAGLDDNTLYTELNETEMHTNMKSAVYYLKTENIEKALHDVSVEELKAQLAEVPLKNKS